jgi:hypothetical protein
MRYRLADMQNRHAGKPAAILGGGPSVEKDMMSLRSQCVNFAINDHVFHIGVLPDYMVFMDDPSIKPELLRIAENGFPSGLRVTELLAYTDVDLRGVPRPDARSGIFATWMALWFGCDPILLCGMDLYTHGSRYCHDRDDFMGHKPIYDEPLEEHLRGWRKLCNYRGWHRIHAISGPLVSIFGSYIGEVKNV